MRHIGNNGRAPVTSHATTAIAHHRSDDTTDRTVHSVPTAGSSFHARCHTTSSSSFTQSTEPASAIGVTVSPMLYRLKSGSNPLASATAHDLAGSQALVLQASGMATARTACHAGSESLRATVHTMANSAHPVEHASHHVSGGSTVTTGTSGCEPVSWRNWATSASAVSREPWRSYTIPRDAPQRSRARGASDAPSNVHRVDRPQRPRTETVNGFMESGETLWGPSRAIVGLPAHKARGAQNHFFHTSNPVLR